MILVFLILITTTICFAIPKFRSDLVAMCSLLALFLSGMLSVSEALAGFSNTVVVMLAVLFVVGEGISQTGLAGMAGNLLIKLTEDSEFKMLIFVMLLVAVMGCFISNTGTVAILMPVVVSLSLKMNIHPGKLLMPLAFGASIGGSITLIGTAPNLLAREALISGGFPGLSFFDFTPIGLITLFTGIVYMWFVGQKLLDKPYEEKAKFADSINVSELLNQYQIEKNLHCLKVPEEHEIVGKRLKELKWPNRYNITVLKVQKVQKKSEVLAEPSYKLKSGDILLLYADDYDLQKFVADAKLQTILEDFHIQDENIAEVILTPQSRLIGKTIENIHFRDKYGLTILSIKRRYKIPKLPSEKDELEYGDALLVHGKRKDIDLLAKEKRDLVVISYEPIAAGSVASRAATSGAAAAGSVTAGADSVESAAVGATTTGLTAATSTIAESDSIESDSVESITVESATVEPATVEPATVEPATPKPSTAGFAFKSTKSTNSTRAFLAGAVLLLMVAMLVFEWVPAVITVIIAGLLMVLTGCVRGTEQAYRAVNWQIVLLIACMLPMATALENTGGIAFIADSITTALGDAGPMVVMAGLYVTASLFGVFISNTATAVLFLPVAILSAQEIGVSPLPLVMAVTYAASMSFSTPVSTPPNAMVMVAGKYTFLDYMKVGVPLQILTGLIILLTLPLFFPF